MKRVMILGCSGSGKSTFTRALSKVTKIPAYHLDSLYWKPNWEESVKGDFEQTVKEISEEEKWIMDGSYSYTFKHRLPKVDTIIFLDRSRWLCLYRVTKRTITYWGKKRPDMGEGCFERFDREFYEYIYHYNRKKRPRVMKMLDELSIEKEIIILKSDKEYKEFLEGLKN